MSPAFPKVPAVSRAALVLLLALTPALKADWPLFRGDALMSGTAGARPEPLPDKLDIKWQVQFKDGKRIGTVEGAPAVVDGVVYVATLDKHLYALELATGKEKWKTKLGYMKASPAVKGGRVYIGDVENVFHCVDAANGKELWKFETGGEINAAANFHGDNVIFGSYDSKLYCLNPKGEKVWSVEVDGPINAGTAVVGDKAFATGCSDGILHVIDAKKGKELGSIDLQGQSVATAAVSGDRLYASMVSNQVVAADLKALKTLWAFEAEKKQQPFHSSPAVADGLVIAGSRDNNVYALDAKTGKPAWVFPTAGQVDASPVVVGGRVYVGCLGEDGNFYVIDLKNGKKIQELELDSPVTGSVAVGPDCVLVATEKGVLFCLGKK